MATATKSRPKANATTNAKAPAKRTQVKPTAASRRGTSSTPAQRKDASNSKSMVSGDDHGTVATRALGAITRAMGSMPAICAAAALIIIWVSGLFFVPKGFGNDTYQLLINTITTVVTFLMVFVIQNVQNRESEATQTKLDAMMQALIDISVDRGMDLRDSPLGELVGMEDEDEKEIEKEQRSVRSAGTPQHN